jgi:flagellar basal-body rod modification protein FlgD
MSTSANSIASLLNSTANTSASTGASSTAIPANMQINETDFLQLISTQLQNQDPLQPTDPSQFLGQLEGSTASLASGGSIAGAVNAPSGATSLQVSIANSSGVPVTSFQVTPAGSGMTTFSWNGATSSGSTAPAGQYTVSVNATVNGASQSVAPMVVTQVQSVTIDPTTQQLDLNTNGGTVPLSSVVTIL